jgi:hypothetical protein
MSGESKFDAGLYRGVMQDKQLNLRFRADWLEPHIVKEITINKNADLTIFKNILDKYGFAVITNVLEPEEIDYLKNIFKRELLDCIDSDEVKKYRELESLYSDLIGGKIQFPKASIPGAATKGFVSLCNFPQGEFAWKTRLNNSVKSIFANLHSCDPDEMCVSLDIPFYNPDHSKTDDVEMWAHTDQNIKLKTGSDPSFQGLLYIDSATTEGTSNTVVYPCSHTDEYIRMMTSIPDELHDTNHTIHISAIPDDDIRNELIDKWNKKCRRIPVPAGSILIFNSKLIHQGYPAGTRLVQPICWEQKVYRHEKAYRQKLQACLYGYGTTHWASLGLIHGASFKKLEKPHYDPTNIHKCIFPHKPINNVTLIRDVGDLKIEELTIEEMEKLIKPEFLSYI